jgi:putative ABC transport system substrate-binding protein
LGRINEVAGELVRLPVAVIVTGGASATKAAKTATSTIQIVMAQDNDPVGSGFVESLARAGRNITGLANQSSEMNGKRLAVTQGDRSKALAHCCLRQRRQSR